MKEVDLATATANLSQYRKQWNDHEFLEFLEQYYFSEDKKRRCMYTNRQGISYGNFVNFDHCNSWHRSLTSQFDLDAAQTREDRVIQILARKTDRKFQRSTMGGGMTLAGHRPPPRDDKVKNSSAAKEMMEAGHSSALLSGSIAIRLASSRSSRCRPHQKPHHRLRTS